MGEVWRIARSRGRETVIRIHCMRKESIFNKWKEEWGKENIL